MADTPKKTKADRVYERIANDLVWLHNQSERETESGQAPRERILWFALAGYLEERGIVDRLKLAATYMQERA